MAFGRLSDPKLITKALAILTAMTDNVNFPTPSPALADISASITDFQVAVNAAAQRDRTKVVLKNRARVSLIENLKSLGNYVTFTANTDSAILSSSGFDFAKIHSL